MRGGAHDQRICRVNAPKAGDRSGRTGRLRLAALLFVVGSACGVPASPPAGTAGGRQVLAVPAPMSPPVESVYRHTASADPSPAARAAQPRVYVPNGRSNSVSVIDPSSFAVVATYPTGRTPQHVVPSYDLRRLWVLGNHAGTMSEIDPVTGRPAGARPVADPYNLYFTPDGGNAIVVAEARQRLEFLDPTTMALRRSVPVDCKGVNHLDFSGNGRYAVVTCEFASKLLKLDVPEARVVATLPLPDGMPQDVRVTGDGRTFFVADLMAGGVHIVDGDSFRLAGFVPTGLGAHGLYPSRDGRSFFVTNRGERGLQGRRHQPGSVSVIDTTTGTVTATWPIPGGGSPDMGNVSADGTRLWLSGRYDDEVYVIDTGTGTLVARIPVGRGPHGLTVWPQPGRFSLGHTGNMR